MATKDKVEKTPEVPEVSAPDLAAKKPTPTPKPRVERPSYDFTQLNSLAVVSIASAVSWVGAVAGIITGHVALAQIKRSGERGRGLAISALILGYLYVAGSLAFAGLMMLLSSRGWIGADSMHVYGGSMNPGMMGGHVFYGGQDDPGMMGFNR